MATQKHLKLWTVNVVSFLLFILLAATGLINWLVLPRGGGGGQRFLAGIRHFLMDAHAWLALLFIVVVAVHLLLHRSYIKANLTKSSLLKP